MLPISIIRLRHYYSNNVAVTFIKPAYVNLSEQQQLWPCGDYCLDYLIIAHTISLDLIIGRHERAKVTPDHNQGTTTSFNEV